MWNQIHVCHSLQENILMCNLFNIFVISRKMESKCHRSQEMRPDAVPSQNLPVALHQNIIPVTAGSFRDRRWVLNNISKACSNIEFPHPSDDETFKTKNEVFMENASVEKIRTDIERPSISREPLLHDQEPVKNIVTFLDTF